LDVEKVVADLKSERDRLGRAIEALEGNGRVRLTNKSAASAEATNGTRRRGITPAGRKRLSEAMKKRWAERNKKR
jgi:hypothetical protein